MDILFVSGLFFVAMLAVTRATYYFSARERAKRKKTRYFLITYRWDQGERYGMGNACFESTVKSPFPGREHIRKKIAVSIPAAITADEICVVNVYDFRNEAEYQSFIGDEIVTRIAGLNNHDQ